VKTTKTMRLDPFLRVNNKDDIRCKNFLETLQKQDVVIMKVGITLPQVGEMATRKNVIELAIAADREERIDSLWVLDRLLWPLKPQTPYRGTQDGTLPVSAQNVFDPIELLTFVAANTEKITLGSSVIDMLFHNPIILGKRFATLDVLSQGRVICGLGIGWSKDEYQCCNIPFMNRGKRAIEFVKVLKKIWTDDVVEFKGEFYNIPASKIGPKPMQKPTIPIYLGGWSSKTFSRIVKSDVNGWLASMGVGISSLEYLQNNIRMLKDESSRTNKNKHNFGVSVLTYPQTDVKSYKTGERVPLTGNIDQIGEDVRTIKEMEVNQIIFCYLFSAENNDIKEMISLTKQLSKFAI
jgi:probable F420-dependent oxidoreductase